MVPGQAPAADPQAVGPGLRGARASLRREEELQGARPEGAGGSAGAGGGAGQTEEYSRTTERGENEAGEASSAVPEHETQSSQDCPQSPLPGVWETQQETAVCAGNSYPPLRLLGLLLLWYT